ncbi:putative alpha- glucosyltransferase alg10 protein [Botrytis fragariae]|uniref:Dol-P-Glc:Glc(2)Man(9)GlcNAc(2)-PP-Dol alpha-1,2-glucosyltransferase n=1 Tax=Botrytis fragariae TaxID=1964551 RepID=A0A8H6EDU6_9HELO|nr:putative alpha- glucosyltransferase alg10 protein [Botrytis fragariae]KAF5868694.1 putative alpha- glucosyltransferase alg10 protein [Botrytis fragariae]
MAGAISTLLVGVLTAVGRSDPSSRRGLGLKTALAVPLTVASLAGFWEYQVTKNVPEPYLDEVFHIPQAQAYCRWDYGTWDPKLTTPPGLYWWSHFLSIVSGFTTCNVHFLRITNVIALTSIMMLAWKCRNLIIRTGVENRTDQVPKLRSADSLHTAANIALFPPLFFFSGLYYTDVLSTCVVLYLYKQFLEQVESKKIHKSWRDGAWFYLCGVLALCMRQTNIFWAAVFLGGMEAVRTMKGTYRPATPSLRHLHASSLEEYLKEVGELVKSEHLHDPPLHAAGLEDLILTPLSIVWTAMTHLPTILLQLIPHISLLITFGAFVFINGGVVLGDKSNHVATIHLSQLLYLWPFIAFFSFPLLIPTLFSFLLNAIDTILHPSKFLTSSFNTQLRAFITLGLILASLLGSLVIIKYNTIIHPFTLADNRHYIFYVFRYSILRHPLIRYLLAPIYIFCFFLIFETLSGSSFKYTSSPKKEAPNKLHDSSSPPTPTSFSLLPSTPLSTLFLLLLTTALSLITAPLVEPRYFILPFIFLRLHFPTLTISASPKINIRLYVETIWYLLINGVTGYIFLYRGFEWTQEPGRVQRFMW